MVDKFIVGFTLTWLGTVPLADAENLVLLSLVLRHIYISRSHSFLEVEIDSCSTVYVLFHVYTMFHSVLALPRIEVMEIA